MARPGLQAIFFLEEIDCSHIFDLFTRDCVPSGPDGIRAGVSLSRNRSQSQWHHSAVSLIGPLRGPGSHTDCGRELYCWGGPPPRSERATLRHPTPPLGSTRDSADGKSLARPWVPDFQQGPVSRHQMHNPSPLETVLLRPATYNEKPQPLQVENEAFQVSERS